MSWVDEARKVSLEQILTELGAERRRQRWGPCPSCHAERRSGSDDRGPLTMMKLGRWYCWACKAHGDNLDLVAHSLVGHKLGGADSERVRDWFAARGWCGAAPTRPAPVAVRPKPPKPEPEPPTFGPQEVEHLWAGCLPASADAGVARWLRERALDVDVVEDRDLVRALPSGTPISWWSKHDARAVVPVYGQGGRLVTLRGRVVALPKPEKGPKVLAMSRAPTAVLADGGARALLRGEPWALALGLLFVTEGEPDFLTRVCSLGEDRPAVVGVLGADSWPAWLGAAVPGGWTVQVDAHRDEAGERLVARVCAELGARCAIIRTVWP